MQDNYTNGVGGIGVPIVSLDKLIKERLDAENSLLDKEGTKDTKFNFDSLTSHILTEFNINKDARNNSGIDEEIINGRKAVNGEYSQDDLGKIASEGGSSIFMNITATKSRCAKSWISDIFLGTDAPPWDIEPSSIVSIPDDIKNTVDAAVNNEFNQLQVNSGMSANQTQEVITTSNQDRRDIILSIAEEVGKEARFQLINMKHNIKDQLDSGGFNKALLNFIEDLCIDPTAFMKGPVITKAPKMTWENGKPVLKDAYFFMNERVSALDAYPSPNATSVQDGNFIEHTRWSPSTLANLRGIEGYSVDAINEILINEDYGNGWLDTGSIEEDIVELERRGDAQVANDGVVHGLHYFGTAPYGKIVEWKSDFKIKGLLNHDLVEVEAIVCSGKVIKCNVNADPLKRRPYYSASYMNRPGTIWGRSLPNLMSDHQRVCNATARSLANNMAVAAGPQAEVNIERLADKGAITSMKPFQIWQTTQDPTGGSGKAINFFSPAFIAGNLLAIYDKFEQKADDVTGIPAFAYGNDRLGGAPPTVGGLSIILESTSKIIKDCIRNIDYGLIKPRIEYQFYWNLIYNELNFTGDIEVVPRGSSVLTTKASEAMRRQEFLQITANQFDQQAMGIDGRIEILRVMAEDLGLPGSAIPSRLDVKRAKKNAEANQAQMQQVDQQNKQADRDASIAATTVQINGQKEMHQGTLAFNSQKLAIDNQLQHDKLDVDVADKTMSHQTKAKEIDTGLVKQTSINKTKEDANLREISLKLQGKSGI